MSLPEFLEFKEYVTIQTAIEEAVHKDIELENKT